MAPIAILILLSLGHPQFLLRGQRILQEKVTKDADKFLWPDYTHLGSSQVKPSKAKFSLPLLPDSIPPAFSKTMFLHLSLLSITFSIFTFPRLLLYFLPLHLHPSTLWLKCSQFCSMLSWFYPQLQSPLPLSHLSFLRAGLLRSLCYTLRFRDLIYSK